MKKLLTIAALIACVNSHAFELQGYKSTSGKTIRLTEATVNKLYASTEPLCVKDGGRIVTVNNAFKAKGLGFRDCSSSDAARITQAALGYKVNVIKLHELPDSLIKRVKSAN